MFYLFIWVGVFANNLSFLFHISSQHRDRSTVRGQQKRREEGAKGMSLERTPFEKQRNKNSHTAHRRSASPPSWITHSLCTRYAKYCILYYNTNNHTLSSQFAFICDLSNTLLNTFLVSTEAVSITGALLILLPVSNRRTTTGSLYRAHRNQWGGTSLLLLLK